MTPAKENELQPEIDFATFLETATSISRPGFDLTINAECYWQLAVRAVRDDDSPSDMSNAKLSRGDLYEKVMRVTSDDHQWHLLQYITIVLVADLLPAKDPITVDGKEYRYEEHEWKLYSTHHPYGEPSVAIYSCQRNGCKASYDTGFVRTGRDRIPQGCNGL